MFKNFINNRNNKKMLKRMETDIDKFNLLMMRSIMEYFRYKQRSKQPFLGIITIEDLVVKLSDGFYTYGYDCTLNVYYKERCESNLIESFLIDSQISRNNNYKYDVNKVFQEIGDVNAHKLISEIYNSLKDREGFMTIESIENKNTTTKSELDSIKNKYK